MSAKVRLHFIDAMKGVAITFIVLYHLLPPSGVKNVITDLTALCLIMFFVLSGYFYVPGKKTYGENLKSRFKGLMVPFFKYSLVFWVIGTLYHLIAGKINFLEALCCLRNFYGGCIWNRVIQDIFAWDYHHLGSLYMFLADFWYLLALMLAFVIFLALADWALASSLKSIGTMLALLVLEAILLFFQVTLPYNMQNTPYFVMLLLFGAFANKVELFGMLESKLSAKYDWMIGAILLLIGIGLSTVFEPSVNLFRGEFGTNQIQTMLTTTLDAVLFTVGLGIVLRRIELAGGRIKEISYLGEKSLYVYLFHVFFAYFICAFTVIKLPNEFKEAVPSNLDQVLSLVLVIVCIALSLLVEYLVHKLGEKKK